MNTEKSFSQQLTDLYISGYMEKIFYFSLKKTGNQIEAEDLSSEISEDIITAISKGTIPEYFSAWVWKIARNRYSLWVRKKIQKNNSVSGADIFEYELEDSNSVSTEEFVIEKEELSILRRELSLISKEYRDILIAYYIEDKKVKTISFETGLPEGTIKTKLYKSRKILTEGMKMARELGIRSYKPEDINFTSSGSMDEKYPWSVVRRVIPKNILLEAHNNPSTLQELSLELGIAAPYLEEEIGFLLDSTLLVKTEDDKYITNFYIFDRDTQIEIYDYLKTDLKLQAELINKIAIETFEKIMKIDFKYNGTADDFKWFIILYMMDFSYDCYSDFEYPERPGGCKWMFTGYESGCGPNDGQSLGHVRSYIDDGCNCVGVFNFFDGKGMDWRACNINNKKCMESIKLLIQMIRNNKNVNSLNDIEKNDWSRISNTLAHSDSDGNVILHIPVITPENETILKEIITSHPEYEKLAGILAENNRYIKNILKDKSNPILHKYLGYYAGTIVGDNEIRIIHDLEDSGDLIIPSDPANSPMGIYLYFR